MLQMILYPIKDTNNKVLEVSGIGFDITENKKNEEKITQSLKEKDVLLKMGSYFYKKMYKIFTIHKTIHNTIFKSVPYFVIPTQQVKFFLSTLYSFHNLF